MGNLTKLLKENQHLKNQNQGLMQALSRARREVAKVKGDTAMALSEIADMVRAYIGALALNAGEIFISHDDVKEVLSKYDMEISFVDAGYLFKLVEKIAEDEADG